MRRTYLVTGALALLAVLAIAACGGGSSSSSPSSSSNSSSSSNPYGGESEGAGTTAESGGAAAVATKPAVVKVMKTPKLGKVIVEAGGMTLYDFHKDKGTMSACYGACATAWPPLLTKGPPKTTGSAEASLLGVTKRKDGTEQVTYNGRPVYGFIEDKAPGETNGNDVNAFGAQWYALQPNGEEPEGS